MVRILLLCILVLSACQVNNSNSGDDVKYSDGVSGIFQNRCSQCHNYGTLTKDQFVEQGLVVAGSPEMSNIFRHLRGSGVGGPEDMPPQGLGEITAEEVQTISEWIETF